MFLIVKVDRKLTEIQIGNNKHQISHFFPNLIVFLKKKR